MSQWDTKSVVFTASKSPSIVSPIVRKYGPQEWTFGIHGFETDDADPPIPGGGGNVYSRLYVSIQIIRRPWFYFWKIFLPNFIITSVGFTSMLVDDYAEQIAIVVTVLLTASAYQIAISGIVPVLPYNTLVDLYLIMCLFVTFTVGVANTIGYIGFQEAPLLTVGNLGLTVAAWVALNLVFGAVAGIARRRAVRNVPRIIDAS